MIYEFECIFTALPDVWVRLDVSTIDALMCLRTGLLNNQQVNKVKVFAITSDTESISFVYDILAANTASANPWSTIAATL